VEYRDYVYEEQMQLEIDEKIKKYIEKLSNDYSIFIISSA
jgi:hypothetical protein